MPATEYDVLPYSNYPHWRTHISFLFLLGRLFGMNPPDYRRCRVLELGGASGGNLMPMAAQFPQSEFVCVDLSAVQTGEGRRHVAALGLSNIDIQTRSILDFDRSSGKFDYILCHGVFSWVPQPVQDRILEIARDHLAPNGVALVSYNTLPGWNAVRSLRDMMLYHCAGFPDPATRAQQARSLLKFVEEAQGDNRSPWADTVRSEAAMLAKLPDSYLAHDHLEENNQAFYLYQFLQRAAGAGLQYLCDADVENMFLGTKPRAVAETLAPLGDVARIEQYLDFVCNRRFRHTLLCQRGNALTRKIQVDAVESLYLRSLLVPQTRDPVMPGDPARTFTAPNGLSFSTGDAATAATLLVMADIPVPMTLDALAREVAGRCAMVSPDAVRGILREWGMRLFLSGGMMLHAHPPAYVGNVSEKPVALPLSRYQASFQEYVTNARHEAVTLGPLERIAIGLLDGSRTRESLAAQLAAWVREGSLQLSSQGRPLQDPIQAESELRAFCRTALQGFATQALLVA